MTSAKHDRYKVIEEIEEIRDEMIDLLDRFVQITAPYDDHIGYSAEVVRTNILAMLGSHGYSNRSDMETITDYLDDDSHFEDEPTAVK